jgi:nucleoside 2-deoxyribosyltransferase
VRWEAGYAYARVEPGFGIDFDEELAEERRVKTTGWPPILRREDSAFTNW